jgi:hypothetical protein
MNILARVTRKRRMRKLPFEVEASLVPLTPQERAMALIKAVDYCLNLKRDDGGIGTQISMALLERDNLSSVECQNLYLNLEEVRRSTQTARLSSAEYEVFLRRHGKSLADDFKSEMGFKCGA